MAVYARAAFALGLSLFLSACLLTPGKFESSLDIRADRSFTFTYKGEVIAIDPSNITKGLESSDPTESTPESNGDSATTQNIAWQEDSEAGEIFGNASSEKGPDNNSKMEAIAVALRKEKGFRSVAYLGNNKFAIDYAISSKLTHGFMFPFNSDAEIMFPFVVIELRGDDRVRVKAPGYANGSHMQRNSGLPGAERDGASKFLDGRFTLTTNAEIVSQNEEDGATSTATGKQVLWMITPLTKEAPSAVLRLSAK